MARKFGKKNIVKVDPLSYNIGLFGLSGIGKTTIIFEMLENHLLIADCRGVAFYLLLAMTRGSLISFILLYTSIKSLLLQL